MFLHAVARLLGIAAWVFPLVFTIAAARANISFPVDVGVINVRTHHGAVGDGVADDTAALQAGINASMGTGGGSRVLYIPDGTYRVTSTLITPTAVGPWVYGQSRDGTVIRLDDGRGAADPTITAVLRTHPSDSEAGSADWFMRNFRNLTIHVGNNPGVDGIRWFGNNSSILQNIRVTGNGRYGINAGFLGQHGPSLIQDVLVEGFDRGISCEWSWGQTISRATIRNCRQVGVYVVATSVAIEGLVVENTPQALFNTYPNDWTWWGGVVALVGGTFSGSDPTQPAIYNRSSLHARGVTASGFLRVLTSETPAGNVAGGALTEYVSSGAAVKLFPDSPDGSLQLPIQPEPVVPWENDPTKWVCANDYGATYGDNTDDTAAIQAAFDFAAANGRTVVYFRGNSGGDPNWMNVSGPIHVRTPVRMVIALGFGRIITSNPRRPRLG